MDSMLRKAPLPKPLMLKDYLLDDLSSCSSSGFRSYPRTQCCSTVRFMLEIDLKSRDSNSRKSNLRSKSTNASSSSKMSAFQRASEVVINAVKLLPFAAVKSSSSSPPSNQSKTKNSILPRSLSRKLLKRSFWKKTEKEIERWKSFEHFLEQNENPSAAVTAATDSNSSMSESNSESNSWSDSDVCSSEGSCGNDVVVDAEEKRRLPEEGISKRGGVTVGDFTIEAATTTTNSSNKWPNEEEKEQFSPVSVLDFPFDDDEEVSWPFKRRLARLEGTKQKLMDKIQQFENLGQQLDLEPVDLEKQFSSSEFEDEFPEPPSPCLSDSIQEEENEAEHKALDLLKLIKFTIPSSSFKFMADDLLLDFLRERITEAQSHTKTVMGDDEKLESELLNVIEDWVTGQPQEMLVEWEVQKNRQAYMREMEKGGKWSKMDEDEHKDEVAMELEIEVFDSLVNELLLDLFSS
ncbi:hypothetical protein LOK49_LG13G01289 [Camellia lanceoleosa]|uniref:Uncharacterized protein n=1 Tax=Camellia lanceoleosa TaxID=1840588 RepID=A0ACC0FGZ2_9ERIC|nr:hypothetical protein LOK49_LG13G01289 [Camellia lanceoleosa]